MSYTPTNWQTGDIVTADKLNKLENGVASGGTLAVTYTEDDDTGIGTLNKTWKEIHDAMASGQIAVHVDYTQTRIAQFIYTEIFINENAKKPYQLVDYNGNVLYAETENDYPDSDSGSGSGGGGHV